MSMHDKINTEEILERVAKIIGRPTQAAIGEALDGASDASVRNWRKRNSPPWAALYDLSKEYKVNFDWLISGEGSPSSIEQSTQNSELDENILLTVMSAIEGYIAQEQVVWSLEKKAKITRIMYNECVKRPEAIKELSHIQLRLMDAVYPQENLESA